MISEFNNKPYYDTVNMTLYAENANDSYSFQNATKYIRVRYDGRKHSYQNCDIRKRTVNGFLGNLQITINRDYVRIYGSLSKWYLGNSISCMSLEDTKKAIEKLSGILHLPLENAIVNRVDITANLIMRYIPNVYYNHLGMSGDRFPFNAENGIYYYLPYRETLLFYDKLKESRFTIPIEYRNKNILRYEKRFKNLNVRVSELYNVDFYNELVKSWYDSFCKIEKLYNLDLNFEQLRGLKDLYNICIVITVAFFRGVLPFLRMITRYKKMKCLSDKAHSDITKKIKSIYKEDSQYTMESPTLKELKETMDAVYILSQKNN